MRVRPGRTALVWFCQILVTITSITLAALAVVLKNFAQNKNNTKWWKDGKGKAPFTVKNGTVRWTDNQALFWNLGWGFLAIGILAFIGFAHMYRKAKRYEDIWGRRGGIFIGYTFISWIGTAYGLFWVIYGFVSLKLLSTSWMPNTENGWSVPEIVICFIIAWISTSSAYSIGITLIYCTVKRNYNKMGYGGGMEGGY